MARSDTTPEAYEVQVEVWRRMGGEGRVALAIRMSESARALARDGVRARHPEYDEEQVRFAWLRMTLGDALFAAAYPRAPMLVP